MDTWHELMVVDARFHSAGSQAWGSEVPSGGLWWFPEGIKKADAIQPVGTTPMARFAHNAIRFTLTTIPYSPHEAGAAYFRAILEDVDWDDPYMDQLAGIVMAKRLLVPQQTEFQFLTLWSVTQDVYYDAEGLKSPEFIIDLEGEFEVNTQAVNTQQHIAFTMLQYAAYKNGFTKTRELRQQLNPSAFSKDFDNALMHLNDHGMITLEKGSVWDFVTITDRGRAYLNGDILP